MPASVCWLDAARRDLEKDSCGCLGSGPCSIPLWMLAKILHHWGLHLLTCKTEQGVSLTFVIPSNSPLIFIMLYEKVMLWSQPLFLKTNLNWLEPSHTDWCTSWLFSYGSLPCLPSQLILAPRTLLQPLPPRPRPVVSHCTSWISLLGLPQPCTTNWVTSIAGSYCLEAWSQRARSDQGAVKENLLASLPASGGLLAIFDFSWLVAG